jgi:hypothetical protein
MSTHNTNVLATDARNAAAAGTKVKRGKSKIFVVVQDSAHAQLHEFDTVAQAEKFLNGPSGPTAFAVIRGHKHEWKQRVSLRG